MGILDFNNDSTKIFSPKRDLVSRAAHVRRDNFYALQNLGHEEMSQDFEDSPHADRVPLE